MLDQLLNSILFRGRFCKAFTQGFPLINTLALSVILGLVTIPNAQALLISQTPNNTAVETTTVQHHFLEDGVYLYGQSPEPEQLGQAYMVFEVKQGQVTGAFYMPRSSFDCFTGVPQGNQLNLSIVEAYSQEAYSYNIPFNNTAVVATTASSGTEKNNIVLQGFHRISTVSENDARILSQCKTGLK